MARKFITVPGVDAFFNCDRGGWVAGRGTVIVEGSASRIVNLMTITVNYHQGYYTFKHVKQIRTTKLVTKLKMFNTKQ